MDEGSRGEQGCPVVGLWNATVANDALRVPRTRATVVSGLEPAGDPDCDRPGAHHRLPRCIRWNDRRGQRDGASDGQRRFARLRKTEPRVTQPLAIRRLDLASTSSFTRGGLSRKSAQGDLVRPVTTSVSHPSRRCTSFNLAGMSICCTQVGRQSPQPTQDVPFRVKAAYSFRARSRS
jgi:hypothetical protein